MIPSTKIIKSPFNGVDISTKVDTSANHAIIFPSPGTLKVQFAAVADGRYIYQVVLPITKEYIAAIVVPQSARFGDYVLLQLFNVASFSPSGVKLDSCSAVFNSAQYSYFFDKEKSIGCVRLTTQNRTGSIDDWTYGVTGLSLIGSGSDVSLQPPKPYNDLPYSVPEDYQCIGAFIDYWSRYPDVAQIDMDPAYHYQTYGAVKGYTWNSAPCLKDQHYINETYCNCTKARATYVVNHNLPNDTDPYQHYLLYQLNIGNGYHCEYCVIPAPTQAPGNTATVVRGYDSKLSIGLGSFTAIAVVIALICAVFLALYWEAFAKHGPLYCSLIVVGVLLSYAAVFVLLPRPTNALCLAFPWFLGIAFSLVYGCLFIKTWALYQVWRNAKNFQRTTLTPAYIVKGILLYCGVEIIYLIIWFVIDPPSVQLEKLIDNTYQRTCKCNHVIFWILFVLVKSVWLVFGAVLSFLTRNMVKEYNESKSIAYAVSLPKFKHCGSVVAYVQSAGVPGAVLVLEVVLIVLAFTFTLVVLFGGVIYRILYPNQDSLEAKLSTLTQKREGTGSQGSRNSRSSSASFSNEHKTSSFDRSGVSGKTAEVYLA